MRLCWFNYSLLDSVVEEWVGDSSNYFLLFSMEEEEAGSGRSDFIKLSAAKSAMY